MTPITAPLVPELLTKSDLVNLLQFSGRQVEILVKAGRLPQPLRLSTHPRWRRSELMAFLDGLAAAEESTNP